MNDLRASTSLPPTPAKSRGNIDLGGPPPGKLRNGILLAFRVVLGLVFAVAAAPKIGDPAGFAENIANYHLVPTSLINGIAIVLPWLELVVAASLLSGVVTRAGALLSAAMLVVFSVAIASAMHRGLDITCGCFGGASDSAARMTRSTLLLDLLWLAMACAVAWLDDGRWSILRLLRAPSAAPGAPK